ncbi:MULTISPECIES: TetR family transcriptional regulator [Micrococcaceae]|uniref:TetR family transcriptional regulator n=1 Tax=unclassified Kocuria TaxID=2649579 RepID=UPI0010114A21|nr:MULTISPECIES: TetR family transcriptional regulator [unclassified Kocuria]
MPRWKPDAGDRLRRAALDLFSERGYEAVTISDIAERADLTRRSFFRYFPDKREVLFAGSDQIVNALERRLELVSPNSAKAEALHVLNEVGTHLLGDIDAQRRRQAIIASSAELQERDRTKTASIGAAIARSLIRHGDDEADAALIGALCAEAFRSAFNRALTDHTHASFTDHLTRALGTIRWFSTDTTLTDMR